MEIPVAAKLPLGHSDTKNQSYAFPLLVILPLTARTHPDPELARAAITTPLISHRGKNIDLGNTRPMSLE